MHPISNAARLPGPISRKQEHPARSGNADTIRSRLKSATRASHRAVDGVFGDYDLARCRDYGAFLVAHAMALLPVERWLDSHAACAIDDWPERRRSDSLLADLNELGAGPVPDMPIDLGADRASVTGVLYVIEGSRLGGTILARRVPAGLPKRYLTCGINHDHWDDFLENLELPGGSDHDISRAIHVAATIFSRFHKAGLVMCEKTSRGD